MPRCYQECIQVYELLSISETYNIFRHSLQILISELSQRLHVQLVHSKHCLSPPTHVAISITSFCVEDSKTLNMTLRFTQIFLLCIARLCYGAVGYAAPQGQSLQDRGNRWLDNATDAAVINLLAEKGQCTYYFDQVYYDLGLESCSIYCPNIYGEFAVDWNVSLLLLSNLNCCLFGAISIWSK